MKTLHVCVLSVLLPAICQARVVDLIIVAGQSNAVGFHTRASELPEDPRDKNVMFWWRGGDAPANAHDSSFNQEWVPLQAQPKGNPGRRGAGNFGYDEGGFGPEMGFARKLLDEQPNRPLAIVKVAYNATGIGRWQPGGNLYSTMLAETNLAIEKAKAMGITLRPRALLWCQGETDANRNPDTEAYRNALETMISTLRKDLDAPELIALLGFNTNFGKRWTKRTRPRGDVLKIRQAQIQIAESSPYAVWVDDWGCQTVNQAHFGSEGTLELGKRYAKALLELRSKLRALAIDWDDETHPLGNTFWEKRTDLL